MLRIHDITVRIRILDPDQYLDPVPAVFFNDLQASTQFFLFLCSVLLSFEGTLRKFSKIKSKKEVTEL